MSQKDMLSIKEAASIADILDGLGQYADADFLDQYIDADGDIEKQAGILDRIKGRLKRWFVGEWRELHDKAKDAQVAIEKRIDELVDLRKDIKKDLKNYRINEWQYKVRQVAPTLGLKTSDIANEFNMAYARYLNYIFKMKEFEESKMKEKGEGGKEPVSPSERLPGAEVAQETPQKPTGEEIPTQEIDLQEIQRQESDQEWMGLGNVLVERKMGDKTVRVPVYQHNPTINMYRILQDTFDKALNDQRNVVYHTNKDGQSGVLFHELRGKLPKPVKERMGGSGAFYEIVPNEDKRYQYMRYIGQIDVSDFMPQSPQEKELAGVKEKKLVDETGEGDFPEPSKTQLDKAEEVKQELEQKPAGATPKPDMPRRRKIRVWNKERGRYTDILPHMFERDQRKPKEQQKYSLEEFPSQAQHPAGAGPQLPSAKEAPVEEAPVEEAPKTTVVDQDKIDALFNKLLKADDIPITANNRIERMERVSELTNKRANRMNNIISLYNR